MIFALEALWRRDLMRLVATNIYIAPGISKPANMSNEWVGHAVRRISKDDLQRYLPASLQWRLDVLNAPPDHIFKFPPRSLDGSTRAITLLRTHPRSFHLRRYTIG